jgi:hypothetical protein
VPEHKRQHHANGGGALFGLSRIELNSHGVIRLRFKRGPAPLIDAATRLKSSANVVEKTANFLGRFDNRDVRPDRC